MPQDMNVLRCCSCKMYQVHMIKQAKKWKCKVCNHKQILKQVFFRGSGKDCRICVQKLNLLKIQENQTNEYFDDDSNVNNYHCANFSNQSNTEKVENKWAKYLDTPEDTAGVSSFSCSERSNYQEVHEPTCLDTNSTIEEYSEIEYVNTNISCNYQSNFEQEHFHNEEEYDEQNDNTIEESETFDNKSNIDSHTQYNDENINEAKSAKNIFDDNEDFDDTINF
ncbi:uncharacterized protein LOC105663607 [Megachile rotundata]|uniref:uncharacterized protein LOC105663607 n=1 Tax=Megachile rotundata TaxID=143995 RepID=UPI000614E7DB|nr:PREDICTED: uncharacterized protein LOC105663607 [Megachile rotundata]